MAHSYKIKPHVRISHVIRLNASGGQDQKQSATRFYIKAKPRPLQGCHPLGVKEQRWAGHIDEMGSRDTFMMHPLENDDLEE
jgi:hypothetical protein